jgi:inorganic pyrophosphatase
MDKAIYTPLDASPAFDPGTGLLNAIIDTPKGSRCKYKYDEQMGHFRLSKLLPLGAYFPYNYGFVPSTRCEDGDGLDVVVLMDEPVFAGCLVPVRLLGVLVAEQTERTGKTTRNDRLIAILDTEFNPPEVQSLDDLQNQCMEEIEHFFVSYNKMEGKSFRPIGRYGPDRAKALVKEHLIPIGTT